MTTFERIAAEAMNLPPEERATLVDRLEQTLPFAGFSRPEIAKAWTAEVGRRIAACERGETTPVNFDEALERIRRRLAEFGDRPDQK